MRSLLLACIGLVLLAVPARADLVFYGSYGMDTTALSDSRGTLPAGRGTQFGGGFQFRSNPLQARLLWEAGLEYTSYALTQSLDGVTEQSIGLGLASLTLGCAYRVFKSSPWLFAVGGLKTAFTTHLESEGALTQDSRFLNFGYAGIRVRLKPKSPGSIFASARYQLNFAREENLIINGIIMDLGFPF